VSISNDRVVQAVDFVSDDPAFAGTMTMTWAVRAVDGGTRVQITTVKKEYSSRTRTRSPRNQQTRSTSLDYFSNTDARSIKSAASPSSRREGDQTADSSR